ncbi:MAG TPA: hypothetical protein VGR28_06170 [Candidatus Thermoplasmatota archaeon]|jgi:hypothetical protein|nr:hypothetical protein [Candidatus Thermoplasmatota archaeon]
MRTIVLAGVLAALFAAGLAVAHQPNPNANCSSVNGDETMVLNTPVGDVALAVSVPGEVPEVGGTTLYVVLGTQTITVEGVGSVEAPAVQVWLESNGYAGLQSHSHSCRTDASQEPGAVTVPADSRLV